MNDTPADKPKWAVLKRLEYIDFRLFWDRVLNRADMAEAFGMSAQQASADIATYSDAAPGNLIYDGSAKTYRRAGAYQAQWAAKGVDRYLLQLVGLKSGWLDPEATWFQAPLPPVEVVSVGRRATNPEHLMAVLDAIKDQQRLRIDYRSLTGSPPSWRTIAPHSIAHAFGRWYVRAWSAEHNDFRDYLLNRIRDVAGDGPAGIDNSLDYEWSHFIDLSLVPNPRLKPEQQEALIEEFEMVEGALTMPVRLSMSFYLIAHLNLDLDPETNKPEKTQLVLTNGPEIEAQRGVARKMSVRALAARGAET
ncbi:helix-turn-helix transcriptional regulator [Brevundimonas faecalis]|uniref:WYL domain-containing protein n=1 Tax=Brevundimonas faecalis TaxID=947378 RepID=A0ABV2RBZ7_9CAUL